MSKILAVDDEPEILKIIKQALQKDGHEVAVFSEPKQIPLESLGWYDLILLDVMMPGIDGFELCSKIRDIVDCPILFLTARDMEDDVMFGFSLGADDYIKKPFSLRELRARVTAHIRREAREHTQSLAADGVRFFLQKEEAYVEHTRIPFTKSEYQISLFLARHHGQVFGKEQIYEHVFGYEGESDESAITEHIKNIRKKLAALGLNTIQTVWGVGYKWKSEK